MFQNRPCFTKSLLDNLPCLIVARRERSFILQCLRFWTQISLNYDHPNFRIFWNYLCEMRSIIGNKLAFLMLTYKTKQSVGFFTRTYKAKHNTDGSFVLQGRKTVSMNILLQKVLVGNFPK